MKVNCKLKHYFLFDKISSFLFHRRSILFERYNHYENTLPKYYMTNSYFIQENCHTEKNPSTSYKSPKRRTLDFCSIIEINIFLKIIFNKLTRTHFFMYVESAYNNLGAFWLAVSFVQCF